jgi:putative oxidoreductase
MVNALVAGLASAGGGLLIAAGLLTPLGVAAVAGMMAAAVLYIHLRSGFFVTDGGFQYPLLLELVSSSLTLTGPGRYSLDHVIGWSLGRSRSTTGDKVLQRLGSRSICGKGQLDG